MLKRWKFKSIERNDQGFIAPDRFLVVMLMFLVKEPHQ